MKPKYAKGLRDEIRELGYTASEHMERQLERLCDNPDLGEKLTGLEPEDTYRWDFKVYYDKAEHRFSTTYLVDRNGRVTILKVRPSGTFRKP